MFIFQIAEIEIKKDNLRNFVERWGEHPNSPYIFESNGGSNFISPPRNGVLADSCLSSRGMLNNRNKENNVTTYKKNWFFHELLYKTFVSFYESLLLFYKVSFREPNFFVMKYVLHEVCVAAINVIKLSFPDTQTYKIFLDSKKIRFTVKVRMYVEYITFRLN